MKEVAKWYKKQGSDRKEVKNNRYERAERRVEFNGFPEDW